MSIPRTTRTDLDLYETIKLKFDKPLADEYSVKVMINPLTGFDYVLDETQENLAILPNPKFNEQTQYNLKVMIQSKHFSDFR